MKKYFITLISFLAIIFHAQATHITGGDIQYRYIGDSTNVNHQYEVTLRVYRDCTPGTSTYISGNISIQSSCYANQSVTLPQIMGPLANGEFNPPTYQDCVPQGSVKCLGIRYFKGIVTLPGLCSDFKFVYQDCCRPAGVDNLAASGSQWFYFEAKLNNFLGNNSSAKFVSEPARAFCIGNTFNWSQAVVELDGDSLKYVLISARGNAGAPLTYNGGYTPAQPLTTNPAASFVLDQKTGIMTFKPAATETVVIALEVQEYRFDSTYYQWVQIGSSNRELVASVASTCSPLAQLGVLLDFNAPGIYVDPVSGLPTVDYTCLDSAVTLHFANKLDCSSVSPDGTDFRLTAPNGQPIPVKELVVFPDVNNETDEMIVRLHEPLAFNGNYYLYSKMGNDGSTLLNKCGFPMSEFDTIQLHVDGCFTTVIDMKNVSVIDDDYPQIEWLLDTVGTPTAPFPKYLVDEYKVYRSDGAAQPYNLIYTLKDYKQMKFNDKSIGWSDVDARSYKYKVDVVVNSFAVGLTRDVHSIWLRTADGAPIFDPAEKIDLVWNSYNGWPSPEYTIFLGQKDVNGMWVETAHVPTGSMVNPTFDTTYFMENEGLVPGDYRVCVRADYPGGSGPYKAWSNCLPFTIYDPPIPPVDTPVTIVIPNIITPNGDGTNDMFDIKNIETWSTTRSVQIFNRWGNLVFEDGSYVNGLGNAWEGKDQSGKKLPDGVYFYMIEVYDQPSETRKNYNGQVTIMGTSN